jgi:hypothetical protein
VSSAPSRPSHPQLGGKTIFSTAGPSKVEAESDSDGSGLSDPVSAVEGEDEDDEDDYSAGPSRSHVSNGAQNGKRERLDADLYGLRRSVGMLFIQVKLGI